LAGGGPSTWAAAFKSNAHQLDSSKDTKPSTQDKPDSKTPVAAEDSPRGPATPDSAITKSVPTRKSSTKAKVPKPKKSESDARSSRPPKPPTNKDVDNAETKEAAEDGSVDNSILSNGTVPPSMFMKLGCGIVDSFATSVTTGVCRSDLFGTAKKPSFDTTFEDGTDKSCVSGASSANTGSQLTDLEKQVWSDWDRRDSSFAKTYADASSVEASTKKEAHEKKREAARDKLLDYASSAISSQMSMSKGLQGDSSEYTDEQQPPPNSHDNKYDTIRYYQERVVSETKYGRETNNKSNNSICICNRTVLLLAGPRQHAD
jgi:hypothetical protein